MSGDPVLIAYGVKKRGAGKRAWWQRIGAAYPHEQGAGLTILLDLMPLDGRIILLERDTADDEWLHKRANIPHPKEPDHTARSRHDE